MSFRMNKENNIDDIRKRLLELHDDKYRDFNAKIVNNINKDIIIGIRAPILRKFARELMKDETAAKAFIADLPHKYYEEYLLHSYIVSAEKNYVTCLRDVNHVLPYVDNWAVCDALVPKIFQEHLVELPQEIEKWLDSAQPYTVRFGVSMLMYFFLDDAFDVKYLRRVSRIESDEYYVRMMIAWYFATALAKRYDETVPFIENKILPKRTHNKTIQKAVESFRVTDEHKTYLKQFRIK